MAKRVSRRTFVKLGAAGAAGWVAGSAAQTSSDAFAASREYGISLASYSLHRTIGTQDGKMPMLDLPQLSREEFGIEAIELVNWMLASPEKSYLDRFVKNAEAHDTKILLIMIDRAGNVGSDELTVRR